MYVHLPLHAITHFRTPLSPVPGPSSSSSARPELCAASAVFSQATFNPSLAQLWRWKRRCFGFWTPLLNILATDLDAKSWLSLKRNSGTAPFLTFENKELKINNKRNHSVTTFGLFYFSPVIHWLMYTDSQCVSVATMTWTQVMQSLSELSCLFALCAEDCFLVRLCMNTFEFLLLSLFFSWVGAKKPFSYPWKVLIPCWNVPAQLCVRLPLSVKREGWCDLLLVSGRKLQVARSVWYSCCWKNFSDEH